MSDIQIVSRHHRLRAYFRQPVGCGPWAGVVVLHDALGQTDDSRRYVDWLATSGYLAVSPDLYSWSNVPLCVVATLRNILARKGPVFEDIEAARAVLINRADCTGRVGVIGFCMGGGFALILASNGTFQTSSVNYGRVPKDAETLLQRACPIVGGFGARDWTLQRAAAKLKNALQANLIAHDVKEYPDAGHAFLNDHKGFTGWAMPRFGMKYRADDADDARALILAFFGKHLN